MNGARLERTGPTQWERSRIGDFLRTLSRPRQSIARRYLAKRRKRSSWSSVVSKELGYAKIDNYGVPGVRDVVDHCRSLIELSVANNFKLKKLYRQVVSDPDALIADDTIMRFVLSDCILDAAIGYLGQVPLLQKVNLWRSTPSPAQISGSQYYHRDHIDTRQAKFFVLLNDVTMENGPLTLIPAGESEKLTARINHAGGRVEDDVLFQHVEKKHEVPFTGKAGDVLIADTSRCFHFGSRCRHGERWVLMFHFTTPLASERNAYRAPLERYCENDPLRRLVALDCA